jgi:N-acetylmuramoyl-L-alanine amidase
VVTIDVAGASSSPANPYHAFLLDNPDRLAFDIPSADFALPAALAGIATNSLSIDSDIAKRVRWGIAEAAAGQPSSGRVVLDLTRDTEYQVTTTQLVNGSTRYIITLTAGQPASMIAQAQPTNPGTGIPTLTVPVNPTDPAMAALPTATPAAAQPNATPVNIKPVISQPLDNVPDSILAGRIILVDPGHGGKDTGAPGVHGVLEKDVVLTIGKLVRDDLVNCGAKVILTRADDTFIPLTTRSQMGVDYHADIFLSIHADSSGIENSHHGTTVYYHANNAVCRQLAETIAQRLVQLDDGIKGDGVRSDFVRFPGVGFSVLRRSPEPAVLVETGYVDSDTDCGHLTDPDIQHMIASAIVAGLKDYVAQGTSTASIPATPVPASESGTVALVQAQPGQ